jgi:hypothetical protein
MQYMLLIKRRRGIPPRPTDSSFAEMGAYAQGLGDKLCGGAPLAPEEQAVRVRARRGKLETLDGPFTESKEVIGGYFMLEAKSDADAIELAKRCPATRGGLVELHAMDIVDPDGAPNEGQRCMLLFSMSPAAGGDPAPGELERMTRWMLDLSTAGKRTRSGKLADKGTRLEMRDGKLEITDGPFAESKEVIGGYAVVRAKTLAEAVDIAKTSPHLAWGDVEVREILDITPPRP